MNLIRHAGLSLAICVVLSGTGGWSGREREDTSRANSEHHIRPVGVPGL